MSLHDVFCVFFKDGLLISNMFLIDHGGIIVDESIRFNKNRQGSMLPEASQRWMAILSTGPWRRLGQGDHRDHRDQPVLRLPLMEKRHSTRRIVTNHVES